MSSSDFFFRFKDARAFSGWAGLAARRAVLLPLFGRAQGRAAIIKQTRHCLAAWRSRASDFAATGAFCSRRDGWEQRARNCQPAFVTNVGFQWPCETPTVCPFCYARAVAELWPVVESAFLPYFDLDPSPFWLLERRYRSRVPTHDTEALRFNYRFANDKRRALLRYYGAVGGYGCLRVEPTKTPANWSFHGRQLYKVPAGASFAATLPGETVTIYHELSRSVLCAALARTCRYPKAWLRKPAVDVAAILDFQARFRIRTSSLLGDFRGSGEDTS